MTPEFIKDDVKIETGSEPVAEVKDKQWDNTGNISRADRHLKWKMEQSQMEAERQAEIQASMKEEERKRKENGLLSKIRRSLGI
jgi:hypothetical protein